MFGVTLPVVALLGMSLQAEASDRDCQARVVFQQVNSLLTRKSYQQAAEVLDRFRSCPDRAPVESFQLGWMYGQARNFEAALQVFSTVPEDVPDRLTHDYAVALAQFEIANYQGAVTTLNVLRSIGRADANAMNLLAVSYSKLGMYREASEVLQQQIAKDPRNLNLYLNLVAASAEGGDFARAEAVATQAVTAFPESADAIIVRGAARSLLGQTQQASQDFAAGVRLAPRRADARFFLALAAYQQSDFTKAASILEAAAAEGIEDSDLHYLRAECLLKKAGSDQAAMRELDEAIRINPNAVAARSTRGKLLLAAGNPKDAAADLEIAVAADPESRTAMYNLAIAYRTLNRTADAQALFSRLREASAAATSSTSLDQLSNQKLNHALEEGHQER